MFKNFSDIQLDVPNAHVTLENFTDVCARDGVIPISFTLRVPSRFVRFRAKPRDYSAKSCDHRAKSRDYLAWLSQ